MTARELIELGDESAIDDAFFNGGCASFFSVDWREYDEEIAKLCEQVISSGMLDAVMDGDALITTFGDRRSSVVLPDSAGARHIAICGLNDVLEPNYQVRYIVSSNGSDTMGFCVLPMTEWDDLDRAYPDIVAANFIDPRRLPNIVTELTANTLPGPAKERFERMLERNSE